MPRKASQKCYKCAALAIEQVHQINGSLKTDPENFVRNSKVPSGGCYDSKPCPPKRSRLRAPKAPCLRNAEVNRQKRALQQQIEQIQTSVANQSAQPLNSVFH